MNFQEKQVWNPLYTYIHLTQCWDKRKQILVGLQDEKLTSAIQYVQARSQHLDLARRHRSEDRYEDSDGVFCCNRFEVNQLVGVRSMKEVYEAAKFFLTNVEISTTEALGHITVREDYDSIGDDGSIGSFRLISARPSGIVTESNKVLYNRYFDHHELLGERPCAVMATDSVDRDDLHPYDPKSRVRLDVSATLVMTEVGRRKRKHGERPQDSGSEAGSCEDEELTVVIQCATFLKALAPEIDVHTDALNAIADGTASWVKVMLQSIRDFINAL
ncbi:hypothetical protein V7S43_014530 [Phytophthora oleae]|uniref:START domain-containing protein n=1 Tax=Phytophthora oleae TaxID=2107226 RepID=A0ABD3F0Q6_9STRA